MAVWVWTAAAIVANGLLGLAGVLLPRRWIADHASPLVGFAAGAMLAAVYVDVLPEAQRMIGDRAPPWALGGIGAMTLLDWALRRHVHGAGRHDVVPTALLTADALHNVADGAAVAAGFLVSPHAGIAVTAAVLAHELPEEIGDFAILVRGGMRRGVALAWLAAVQMTAAVGAVATLLAAEVFESVAGVALALATGTFLYVALACLLPEVLARPQDVRARAIGVAATLVGAASVVMPEVLLHAHG